MNEMSTKRKVHEILQSGRGLTDQDFVLLMKRKSEIEQHIVSMAPITSRDLGELAYIEKGIEKYKASKVMSEKRREKEKKQKEKARKRMQDEQEAFNTKYSKVLANIRRLTEIMKQLSPYSDKFKSAQLALTQAYRKKNKLERKRANLKAYNRKYAQRESEESRDLPKGVSSKNSVSKQPSLKTTERDAKEDIKGSKVQILQSNTFGQLQVTAKINWEDVTFYDNQISIKCLGRYFNVECLKSRHAYNSLINTFIRRLPPIEIEIHDSKVVILNQIAFQEIIELLHFRSNLFSVVEGKMQRLSIRHFHNVSKEVLRAFFPLDKTDYLNYLQNEQDSSIRYIPVYESTNETPDGFLFTINYSKGYLVVWESTSEMDHRATYVFETSKEEVPYLHQLLFDYIMSEMPNKRQNLRLNRIKEFVGFNYTYVDHDDFISWQGRFKQLLENVKNNDGLTIKKEDNVKYVLSESVREYTPKHNIMQNRIRQELEKSGLYSQILLESGHVDIKALTHDGKWHYFEVKTSCPRYCIREGLGQILEYVHFSNGIKAEKLFIVGPQKMSDHEKSYIQLLRNVYNLPIWYRWYDDNHSTIKEPNDS